MTIYFEKTYYITILTCILSLELPKVIDMTFSYNIHPLYGKWVIRILKPIR